MSIVKKFIKNLDECGCIVAGPGASVPRSAEDDEFEFNEDIAKILLQFIGRHNYMVTNNTFSEDEVKMGKEVELEHIPDTVTEPWKSMISTQIVMDHLMEIPDYYTRLKLMETEGKLSLEKKEHRKTMAVKSAEDSVR